MKVENTTIMKEKSKKKMFKFNKDFGCDFSFHAALVSELLSFSFANSFIDTFAYSGG